MNARSTVEPLVVTPREACALLGIGNTRLYRLLGDKLLDSYKDGKSRRIPITSIKSYIAQRLAESMGARGRRATAPARRRGRPRKISEPAAAAAV